MQRILDIDLDAFVYGTAHYRERNSPRLDPEEFPAWELDTTLKFLEDRCRLDGPRPGAAVEHHAEIFFRWRELIDRGLLVPPFEVTHLDAHADLGLGDSGFTYLLTDLLGEPPEDRHDPMVGDTGLGDGNYLAFAIANRWISRLDYAVGGRLDVFDDDMQYPWRPVDLLPYLFANCDPNTRTICLPHFDAANLRENLTNLEQLRPLALEPAVAFDWEVMQRFDAETPFDFVFLARSPGFTPATANLLYDEIQARFIDENPSHG